MDIQKVATYTTAAAVVGTGSIVGGGNIIDQQTGGPEKRTRNLEEKALGIDATNWLKKKLEDTIAGDGDELTIRTELVGGQGKYGRLLGWLYINEEVVSLNEQMITEGYAHAYDGGTKDMNLEKLREIRRSFGTLIEA